MTQAPSGSSSLSQAWDDLVKWLSNAPPSVQAQAVANPQATLAQHGLGGVSGPQLQSAINNSGTLNAGSFNHGHTVNQGLGNAGGGFLPPCPPGTPPTEVFNYAITNNYSQIVDNSINVGGDFTGDIDQKNVVGDGNSIGDEFDIDGDVNGQLVTGDHNTVAGGDLDDSVMGAGAVRMGDGNSFGNGTNFGSGTSDYTDNRGATIDNSVDNSYQDNSYSDSSYSDSSVDNSQVDNSVDNSYADNSTDNSSQLDSGGGDVDVDGNNNF
jgi:hypothetical protein